MTDYPACFNHIFEDDPPKYSYLVTDTLPDYDDITWLDEREKPTREDCDSLWPFLRIELHNEDARTSRERAYREESDSLFFSFQRGESTEEEWLSKVNEIRSRFPYIEE